MMNLLPGLQKFMICLNNYYKINIIDWEEQNFDLEICNLKLKQFKAYIGIKAELTISWSNIGGSASVALMAEGGLRVKAI